MTADLFWIPGPWPGRLAITTRPRGGDWLADEAAAWRRQGLDVVVSLLEPDEARQLGLDTEPKAATHQGLEFLSFPIPDRGLPPSRRDALGFLTALAARLDAGRNIAIHCRQSVGRAGLITAALLMLSGATPEQALQTVTNARRATVPETLAQRQWALDLPVWILAPQF